MFSLCFHCVFHGVFIVFPLCSHCVFIVCSLFLLGFLSFSLSSLFSCLRLERGKPGEAWGAWEDPGRPGRV